MIDGDTFLGDQVPGIEFPDIDINDDGDVEELGDTFIASGVTELVINGTGFGAPIANVVINFTADELLDVLDINVPGNVNLRGNGNAFNLVDTTVITGGDLTQSDNRPGISTDIDLGNLSFRVGGNADFQDLAASLIGGEVAGNLSLIHI